MQPVILPRNRPLSRRLLASRFRYHVSQLLSLSLSFSFCTSFLLARHAHRLIDGKNTPDSVVIPSVSRSVSALFRLELNRLSIQCSRRASPLVIPPTSNDGFAANYELSAMPHSLQFVLSYPAPPCCLPAGREGRLVARDDNGCHVGNTLLHSIAESEAFGNIYATTFL